MEFQEAGSSSTARVKIDFVQPMAHKESKWNHRKSLAWDTAFSTNPGVLDPEELFGSLKIDENEIEVEVNHNHTLPSKTDARPSFAWDNAFFTDPGVLDAEELCLVNNGFTSNTQLRKSADTTTTQGSRFSVASIEFDLFHDLRASLRNSPNVKQTVTQETHRKLPDGIKRTKGYKQKVQPLSLIPQPKVSSSSSSSFSLSSISKSLTPSQAIREKKCVASELERNKVKHKNHGFEEQSGSKSNIRSSYSSYAVKDLTSSYSGLRLPLPKMGFFDSENGEKENREPNALEANRRRRHKSKLETSSTPENRSILGQRKTRK
ncbi:hypothetical protein AtNW77_Chr2g0260401 [Arabidopsis thaliana]|uniref:Uncharacterized protein n=1 Tax=Arabidopsis thaliana x Arabidopsis arenosa TaxID=1240361 RepID=A0A8T2FX98_9BRAS|nr:hypothetical protein ISN45_At02g033810 [Arabidopsis thaliana x Arabidopsis arenosa]